MFRPHHSPNMGAARSANSAGNASSLSFLSSASASSEAVFPLPPDILVEIFLNLPPNQVVCVIRLVCHQWKDLADGEFFWRERCRREGYHLQDASRAPSNWRLFYFMCKRRRNLLKNPRGEDGFLGWDLSNGGDGWNIERPIVPHPNEAIQKNFATSYQMCIKSQMIELEKEGYSPSFMDEFQPSIRISDWYAPRCRCEYVISVQLLNHRKEVLQEFNPDAVYLPQFDQQIGDQWHQMTHVFKNYGPGVRYIQFIHGGKDSVFWKGWYGARVTESCVEVFPAMDT
nr:F-box only protein 6 isoform X1 [Nothobranchius furzeri]